MTKLKMDIKIIRKFLLIVMFFMSIILGHNPIKNVDWDINNDNEMVINYDLSPLHLQDTYKISISITYDGGRSWFTPRSVSGDLLKQKMGNNKEIIWDIFSDVDELEGDVDVEVVAKLHRTILQRLTIPAEEKMKKFEGINVYFILPIVDFDNSTFRERKDTGLLDPANFPHSFGGGVNFMFPPLTMDLHASYASFASSAELPYIKDSGGLDYDDFDTSGVFHSSTALYFSYTFLPGIPVFLPSFGLGFQVSSMNMMDSYYDQVAKAYTSDLFYVGNLSMVTDMGFYQLSYKHSLTRKLRAWTEIQLILGVHL